MRLRPFFSYLGSKWQIAPTYPSPTHPDLIEPFAGSAGYATRHHQLNVRLYEADPIVAGIWDYLIRVRASEVLRLPPQVAHVDEVRAPQEAKWLIGFWLEKAVSSPKTKPGPWAVVGPNTSSHWGQQVRDRIATQVEHVRHWQVTHGSYADAPNTRATWFIDPPYVTIGNAYRHHRIDYAALGEWCRSRNGQAIVCEAEGAAWLPFLPHRTPRKMIARAARNDRLETRDVKEVVWTNTPMPNIATAKLTPSRLADCETIIERALRMHLEAARALRDIRDQRLYLEDHDTFAAYCTARWGMTRTHADRMCAWAEVAENFHPNGGALPSRESHARPLSQLPPAQQREAFQLALASGGATAATIARACEVVGRKPQSAEADVRSADRQRVAKMLDRSRLALTAMADIRGLCERSDRAAETLVEQAEASMRSAVERLERRQAALHAGK